MDDAPIMNEGPDQQVFLSITSPTPTPLIWDSSLRPPYYASIDRLWFKSTDWNAHPNHLRNRFTLTHSDRPSETTPFAGASSTIPFHLLITSQRSRGLTTTYHSPNRALSAVASSTAERRPKRVIFYENDRAAALATALPAELLDNILYYAGYKGKLENLNNGTTYRPRAHKGSRTCSLVCIHWANKCRQYMFSGATLRVISREKAEMLIHYALHGCASLVPVHTLISEIDVVQNYATASSFLHRISLLRSLAGQQLKCSVLYLSGPIPDGFPYCKLDTPHWSIPSSVPTPPSMLSYHRIHLSNIHLPSFTHAAKYISHFQLTSVVHINHLTWDNDRMGSSTQAVDVARVRRGNFYKMRNEEFQFNVSQCTDTIRLFLHALMVNVRSPLYAISDDPPADDRGAMIGFLQEICPRVFNMMCWARIDIVYFRKSLPRGKLMVQMNLVISDWTSTFMLEDRAFEHSPPTPNLRVVGFLVEANKISGPSVFGPVLGGLMPHLHRFVMLHAIAIIFGYYEELLDSMSRYRPSPFHPLIFSHKYVLVLYRCNNGNSELDFPEVGPLPPRDKSDYIGINPITLLPTGQIWNKKEDIMPSLLEIPGP